MSDKKAKAARREQRSFSGERSQRPSASSHRTRTFAIWIVLVAVSIGVAGYGIQAYWKSTHPAKALHEFSSSERSAFVAALKAGGGTIQSVWLACPGGRVETCRLVGQFIGMFRDSGWSVEENRVMTWNPAHPLGGVHLIVHASGGPDDSVPADTAGLKSSFSALGIP
ncbi:MAG TPA: hypothetical protein VK210_08690, partial [Terriglobia bacterium]|nr:hypothetical protein [Terriglobia bacterium]